MEKKDSVLPPIGVEAWHLVAPDPVVYTTIARTPSILKIEPVACRRKTFSITIYSLH
jgi:hypothetical protein